MYVFGIQSELAGQGIIFIDTMKWGKNKDKPLDFVYIYIYIQLYAERNRIPWSMSCLFFCLHRIKISIHAFFFMYIFANKLRENNRDFCNTTMWQYLIYVLWIHESFQLWTGNCIFHVFFLQYLHTSSDFLPFFFFFFLGLMKTMFCRLWGESFAPLETSQPITSEYIIYTWI